MFNLLRNSRYRPLLEWGGWCLLVALLWQQTDHFDQPMSEFLFGADGWPKVVLLLLLLGASAQMANDLLKHNKKGQPPKQDTTATQEITQKGTKIPSPSRLSWYQVVAVFCLPLLYVFLMRRIGFFLATPLFIVTYLWTLEVRRWHNLFAVTLVVLSLVLFLFVRLFYVALPVGSWEWAYAINNFIVALVRTGL